LLIVSILVEALVDVDQRLHACVVIVDDLLLVLNILHPILVAGVDVDPGIVDLVDLTVVVQVVVVEVAHRII
jgi:hypothetical protein